MNILICCECSLLPLILQKQQSNLSLHKRVSQLKCNPCNTKTPCAPRSKHPICFMLIHPIMGIQTSWVYIYIHFLSYPCSYIYILCVYIYIHHCIHGLINISQLDRGTCFPRFFLWPDECCLAQLVFCSGGSTGSRRFCWASNDLSNLSRAPFTWQFGGYPLSMFGQSHFQAYVWPSFANSVRLGQSTWCNTSQVSSTAFSFWAIRELIDSASLNSRIKQVWWILVWRRESWYHVLSTSLLQAQTVVVKLFKRTDNLGEQATKRPSNHWMTPHYSTFCSKDLYVYTRIQRYVFKEMRWWY